tara:strand:- start:798 stop:1139 length:342 start_codon:yes stop_codon:yes gene_type:complete
MSEFKDFDEAVAEADEDKLTFKVAGKVYEAPAQLPAKVVLTQLKLSNEEGGIEQNQLGEWLTALIGQDTFEDMLKRNVSWKQLEAVLQYLLEEYGVVPKAGDDAVGGEEEDPK